MPPKAAFNRNRVELQTLDQWLSRNDPGKRQRGRIQQRGMGDFVLCEQCNNLTGRRYVPELERWTRAGAQLLGQLPANETEDADPDEKVVEFGVRDARPLLFVKQIAAMTLATNGGEFRKRNQPLAEFVLDSTRAGMPEGYNVYLVLYRGPVSRVSGVSGRLNVETGRNTVMSEIAHPPFAYVMSFDEEEPALPVGNITSLAELDPDEVSAPRDPRRIRPHHLSS